MSLANVFMISAGAGSGKTTSIVKEVVQALTEDETLKPANLIITTFTKKAAEELKVRIAEGLLEAGLYQAHSQLQDARIGTVHSICFSLLEQYGQLINHPSGLRVLTSEQKKRMISSEMHKVDLNDFSDLDFRLGLSGKDTVFPLSELTRILDYVTELGLSSEEIEASRKKSVERLFQRFKEAGWEPDEKLFKDLSEEIKKIHAQFEELKLVEKAWKPKSYNQLFLNRVTDLKQSLQNQHCMKWRDVQGLIKQKTAKEHESSVQPLRELAAKHHLCKEYQDDLHECIEKVFDLACDIERAYQQRKADQGMVDYNDMEESMLQLLQIEHFKQEFSSRVRLVLVDEFQDTSPKQLKIFSEWTALCEKSIWVGDLKQAIYGFRGTDVKMVQAVTQKINKKQKSTLKKSWRSRPELVDAANHLFTRAFEGSITKEQVELCANKSGDRNECLPPLMELKCEGKNKPLRYQELGQRIIHLIRTEKKIVPKGSRKPRPIRFEDIAILFAMNDSVAECAKELGTLGIPVAYFGKDVYKEDVARLFTAMLENILEQKKPWSETVIDFYSSSKLNAQTSLQRRLDLISGKTEYSDSYAEMELLQTLNRLREEYRFLSFDHFIDKLIHESGIVEISASWGEADKNSLIVDAFRSLATKYQQYCNENNQVISLHAFIPFLQDNLQEELNQTDFPGLKLMTYHKSKGLEWPVVIMHELDKPVKARVFGVQSIREKEGGESKGWIRYWPCPYSSRSTNVSLFDLLEQEKQAQAEKELEEEKRILYVGFTRARETVIIAHDKQKTGWIDRAVYGGTDSDIWQDEAISLDTCPGSDEEPLTQPVTLQVKRTYRAESQTDSRPYFINPSLSPAECAIELGDVISIGDYLPLKAQLGKERESDLGDLFHQYLAFGGNAEDMIRANELEKVLDKRHLEVSKKRLTDFMSKNHSGYSLHHEIPVSLRKGGQRIEGIVDMVLESDKDLVIIDHKSYPGSRSQLRDRIKAKGYPGQLYWYKLALEEALRKPVRQVFLHFPISASLVPVEYKA